MKWRWAGLWGGEGSGLTSTVIEVNYVSGSMCYRVCVHSMVTTLFCWGFSQDILTTRVIVLDITVL